MADPAETAIHGELADAVGMVSLRMLGNAIVALRHLLAKGFVGNWKRFTIQPHVVAIPPSLCTCHNEDTFAL